MTQFHIVMANVTPGVTIEDVQRAIQAAQPISWYRIASNVWVVHSDRSAAGWATTLRPLTSTGSVFVGRFDPSDKYGWVDPAFWTWLSQQETLAALLR